ncbi:MAG: hypothetical protein V4710_09780 [Verrucomicrobiota bacterium]
MLLLRWACALGIEFIAFKLLGEAANGLKNPAWSAMWGFAFLIFGAYLIGPEIISLVSAPVHHFINGLIFPAHSEPPPVDYTLARFYRRKLRFQESLEAYLKIIQYHPQEFSAYVEGIDTAFECGEPEMARKFRRMGSRKLRSADERRQLKAAFTESENRIWQEYDEESEVSG